MKCAFIYNPNSGKGYIKKKLERIVAKLKTKYDEVIIMPTQYPKHAKDLANSICLQNLEKEDKIDTLIVAGGDGTINEVVSGIAENSIESRPVLGLIPCGTVNDLSRSLNLPNSLNKRLDVILNGKTIDYDYFMINDKSYGIYVCCTGLFTQQSYSTKQKKKKFFGKIAYAVDAVNSLAKQKPVSIEFEAENVKIKEKCSIVLAINSSSVAGLKLNKKANIDDGKVDVVILPCSNRLHITDLVKVAKLFVLGVKWAKKSKKVKYFNVDNFTLKTDQTMNVDGEKLSDEILEFKTQNPGIKILVK